MAAATARLRADPRRASDRNGGRRLPTPSRVPMLTATERAARGRAARTEVPRASHAVFEPSSHRPDPIALLEEQAKTRVPELVPIRYGRMLVSPFAFFRGGALIMASDLDATPTSGIRVQVCGDAHMSNFGVFDSPERRQMFDVNDFDETLPGPWEWDVKRLAASLAIAGRENGYSQRDRRTIVLAAAGGYRRAMTQFAGMHTLDVWYAGLDVARVMQRVRSEIPPKRFKLLERSLARARTRDSLQAFSKLTEVVDGKVRISPDRPLIVPVEELAPPEVRDRLERDFLKLLGGYRATLQYNRRHLIDQFRFVQLARKVVGVGSVGTRAWIGLFMGVRDGDALFLQMKEAEESVLERFVGLSEFRNHGQRVVAGQLTMQVASDIFLGWERVVGLDGQTRDFYLRQLRDGKWSIDASVMLPRGMAIWGGLCGWTLARAHARSGDRIAIASYLGTRAVFDRAMVDFAEAYADQNEHDYKALRAAAESGRIQAEMGL
jgi:uncharacterized protein (DUF2252 family)